MHGSAGHGPSGARPRPRWSPDDRRRPARPSPRAPLVAERRVRGRVRADDHGRTEVRVALGEQLPCPRSGSTTSTPRSRQVRVTEATNASGSSWPRGSAAGARTPTIARRARPPGGRAAPGSPGAPASGRSTARRDGRPRARARTCPPARRGPAGLPSPRRLSTCPDRIGRRPPATGNSPVLRDSGPALMKGTGGPQARRGA